MNCVNPNKDVDGFHPLNYGKMTLGIDSFVPATPHGILELIKRYKIDLNGKKCLVEITFSVGNKNYKIIRGLKPNIFEIWVNDEMINQESHSRDFQKLLETNILKLNHKSFHQVVVLGNGNFVPFMQMRQYERRNVIEDLLDISIFSKMNTILKENNAKLKDQIKDNEYQWKLIKEKIILYICSFVCLPDRCSCPYTWD